MSFDVSELMVHLAPGSFTTDMPFDMNVMFEADTAGTIGLVHDMRNEILRAPGKEQQTRTSSSVF
jgi:hypothetical protein